MLLCNREGGIMIASPSILLVAALEAGGLQNSRTPCTHTQAVDGHTAEVFMKLLIHRDELTMNLLFITYGLLMLVELIPAGGPSKDDDKEGLITAAPASKDEDPSPSQDNPGYKGPVAP
ncbi:hypothetical protein FOZ61_008070 [Perkinsus olseni]|uniref:Uncharacterized protein n=1 Tax=Perkinsus olseni TaxID=32597 RepID=A0A7J6L6D3_PEROL|nr:hypothetical protein FOZ61_008070 [Perkinsus olseni]